MNNLIKHKWIDALRSGKYKQGKYYLKTINDEYCCLGVLTQLYVDEHPNTSFIENYLPLEVVEWANLKEINPIINGDFLANLNDNGKTFDQIASLIDTYL